MSTLTFTYSLTYLLTSVEMRLSSFQFHIYMDALICHAASGYFKVGHFTS